MTPRELILQLLSMAPNERPSFVASLVAPMADSLNSITLIVNLADADPASFVAGLESALLANPRNLTAGRALIWFHIRSGDYSKANRVFKTLAEHWPNHGDIFLEHVRLLILTQYADRASTFKELSRYFVSRSRRRSYALQVRAGASKVDLQYDLDAFDAVGKEGFYELLRGPRPEDRSRLSHVEIELMWTLAKKISEAASVAIVGNAHTLRNAKHGSSIDSHDLVIRCNYPLLDQHREDVGNKVDLVFFNEAIRREIPELQQRSALYRDVISLGMHTDPNFGFLEDGGMSPGIDGTTTLPPRLRQLLQDISYSRATTGLMAIILISVIFGKDLTIYGFDFFQNGERAHYYDQQKGAFLGHELQYERWYVHTFLRELCGFNISIL